ncbi:MAG: phosphodiester glycosidase family protein [Proteobacteria bacterium]|nr:phosphodiester glycosidase family protein [Pseudomonadota bacterium]
MRRIAWLAIVVPLGLGCGGVSADAGTGAPSGVGQAYSVERFSLPGPVNGVLARIDLDSRRVHVEVALADDRDPDGAGPCVGQMEVPSVVARKHAYSIAINASFFATPHVKEFDGRKISYFVGNCGYPEGWHFSGGKLISSPVKENLRATMIVHGDGHITLTDRVMELPPDTKFAVSGNAMVLAKGELTPSATNVVRHPRSAVGLSADGKTLYLVAIDGRQDGHSRGVTLAELARIFQTFGADSAINLDGGGSTSMVLKDTATGVFTIANQPSEPSSAKLPVRVERPVIDVVGIVVE